MSKHSGENTLLQIFKNIKAQVDSLKRTIDSKQEPFIVTAAISLTSQTSGTLTNMSHTFAQIAEAHDRGDHIFLEVDISQLISRQKTFLNLSNYRAGEYVIFEQTMRYNDAVIFLVGRIDADNSNVFSIRTLAEQTQLGGLTFNVSTSVPVVDDRSVITFVIEE